MLEFKEGDELQNNLTKVFDLAKKFYTELQSLSEVGKEHKFYERYRDDFIESIKNYPSEINKLYLLISESKIDQEIIKNTHSKNLDDSDSYYIYLKELNKDFVIPIHEGLDKLWLILNSSSTLFPNNFPYDDPSYKIYDDSIHSTHKIFSVVKLLNKKLKTYLKSETSNIENDFKQPTEDELSKFSRHSKLLILHFLGLNLNQLQNQPPLTQKKLSILLSYVTGRTTDNIKRSLGNINEDREGHEANPFRTKNLKEIKDIFDDLKLYDYSTKVNDIIINKKG